MNTLVERFQFSTHQHKLHRGAIEMHSFFSNRRRCFLALFSLLASFTLAVSAQEPASPPAAATHSPDATANINILAHRLLNDGMKSNALTGGQPQALAHEG